MGNLRQDMALGELVVAQTMSNNTILYYLPVLIIA